MERLALERNISYIDLDQIEFRSEIKFFLNRHFLQSIEGKNFWFTSYDGVITLEDSLCMHYLMKHSDFLSSLQPLDYIAEAVEEVRRNYFSSQVLIGIHCKAKCYLVIASSIHFSHTSDRWHDPLQDWAVVPPAPGVSAEAGTFGEGAGIEDFISIMTNIQRACVRSCRFFVASNSQAHKQALLQAFPDAVSLSSAANEEETRKGKEERHPRSTSEGMVLALIEWLLLSEAALVVNTYGSSFAVEAALRRLRPVAGVWQGQLLLHSSLHLPFCGHMQFAQAALDSPVRFSYREGTVDGRAVEGSLLAMQPCDLLQNWGLHDVMCKIGSPSSSLEGK